MLLSVFSIRSQYVVRKILCKNDDLDYQLPHDPSTDVEKLNQQLAAFFLLLVVVKEK
jgi:hypothetical protein